MVRTKTQLSHLKGQSYTLAMANILLSTSKENSASETRTDSDMVGAHENREQMLETQHAHSAAEHPLPNRLSAERSSPYFTNAGALIGCKLDGEDVTGRVVEYNVVMGWVRLLPAHLAGQPVDPFTMKQAGKTFGKVEPYWRTTPSRQVRRQIARIPQ